MRMTRVWVLVGALTFWAMVATGAVSAAEGDLDLGAVEAIASTLQKQVGKRVTLKLASGQELEGTVVKVGPTAVQLSQLAGKEFFDAVVRLDHVSALILRTKSK